MADDRRAGKDEQQATGDGSYLRIVPGAPANRCSVPSDDATRASQSSRAARTPSTDDSLAELTEIAAAVAGGALARLSLAGSSRVWWVGARRDCVARGVPGALVLEHLFDCRDPDRVEDTQTDPRYRDLPREGIFAWCRGIRVVPVPGAGGPAGTLAVFFDLPLPRDAAPNGNLERIAGMAGTLWRAQARRADILRRRREQRRLERAISRAQWSAQRTLSGRLHEEVANHLAGTALLVQSITNRAPATAHALRADLGEVGRQLHAALAESRALACDNAGYLIETHGLAQALSIVVRRLGVAGVVACGVIADADAMHGLSQGVAQHIVAIAEVAVRRACASRATSRVTVRLRRLSRGGVRLSVTADSQWIAPEPAEPPQWSWEALRYHACRIGADVCAHDAGPAAHRLDIVRRTVSPRRG